MMGESKSCMTSSFFFKFKVQFLDSCCFEKYTLQHFGGEKGIWSFLVCEDVLYARFCTRKCSPEEESVGEEGRGYQGEKCRWGLVKEHWDVQKNLPGSLNGNSLVKLKLGHPRELYEKVIFSFQVQIFQPVFSIEMNFLLLIRNIVTYVT